MKTILLFLVAVACFGQQVNPYPRPLVPSISPGGGPPTGVAGGALNGTYPNPGIPFTQTGAGATPQTASDKLKQIVSVDDWGAVSDGVTDNTTAINNAIANTPQGAEVFFPCLGNATYLVTGVINFRSYQNIRGTGSPSCTIQSTYSGAYAFNLIGVDYTSFENIRFFTSNVGSPPKVNLMLGRDMSSDPAGRHNFRRVQVDGYTSQALVYSIASEENIWDDVTLLLDSGATATHLFYTNDNDALAIGGLPASASSNKGTRISGSHFEDFTSTSGTPQPTHDLIFIGGGANESGGFTFRDGFGSVFGGTGINISPTASDTLSGSILLQSNVIENVAQFIKFNGSGSVNGVDVLDNDMYSPTNAAYFAFTSATTVNKSRFAGNIIETSNSNIGSTFYNLSNSTVTESFPITVSLNFGSTFNGVSGGQQIAASTIGGAFSLHVSTGAFQSITLTGNGVLTVDSMLPGLFYQFHICQDSSGGHTLTWPANVFGGGAPDTTLSKCSDQLFWAPDASNLYAAAPMVLDNVPYMQVSGSPTSGTILTYAGNNKAQTPSAGVTLDGSGNVVFGNVQSVVNQGLRENLSTPGSSSASCSAGQIWADTSFFYACTATNTIKRVAITTF